MRTWNARSRVVVTTVLVALVAWVTTSRAEDGSLSSLFVFLATFALVLAVGLALVRLVRGARAR